MEMAVWPSLRNGLRERALLGTYDVAYSELWTLEGGGVRNTDCRVNFQASEPSEETLTDGQVPPLPLPQRTWSIARKVKCFWHILATLQDSSDGSFIKAWVLCPGVF